MVGMWCLHQKWHHHKYHAYLHLVQLGLIYVEHTSHHIMGRETYEDIIRRFLLAFHHSGQRYRQGPAKSGVSAHKLMLTAGDYEVWRSMTSHASWPATWWWWWQILWWRCHSLKTGCGNLLLYLAPLCFSGFQHFYWLLPFNVVFPALFKWCFFKSLQELSRSGLTKSLNHR